jgi:acyl-CoA thioester hydrolase
MATVLVPEDYPHQLPVRVRFCETDANGHVSQVSYFIYFEEARSRLMEALEFPWFQGEYMLVLARQWADYLQPAFFPDRLTVYTAAVAVGRSSLRLVHRLTRAEDPTVLCQGESTMVLVRQGDGRSAPWPETLRHRLDAWLRPDLALPFDR